MCSFLIFYFVLLGDGVGFGVLGVALCCAPGALGWPGPWFSLRFCELPAPAPAFRKRKNVNPVCAIRTAETVRPSRIKPTKARIIRFRAGI
jgi:hypothetical protein